VLNFKPMNVSIIFYVRLKWRSYLLVKKTLPVGTIEPAMRLYLFTTFRPQPFLWILIEKFLQEVLQQRVADKMKRGFFLANLGLDCSYFLVRNKKWWKTRNHFEDDVSKSPPICSRTDMVSLFKDLGRQIFRSPSYSISGFGLVHFAAESKIDELDESLAVNEHIFWLEAVLRGGYSR